MKKSQIGQVGEQIASEYLSKKNYTLVQQNYRTRHGEIDLIFTHPSGHWVFIEVKHYQPTNWVHPLETITSHKINSFIKTAMLFLSTQKPPHRDSQFDLISIQNNRVHHHYENIISPYST